MSNLPPQDFTALCQTLAQAIDEALADPANEELQRKVCLASRALDSGFFTDSVFRSVSRNDVNQTRMEQVSGLFNRAKDALPVGSKYWESVVERIHEMEDVCDRLSRGSLLDITTVNVA